MEIFYFLSIYLTICTKFSVANTQPFDNSTQPYVVTKSPSIANTTNQPSENRYIPKGNLACVHLNYDLMMTFFNNSNDVEELMAKSSKVECTWKKSNGASEIESRPFSEMRKIEIKNSTLHNIPNKIFSNFSKLLIFKARDAKIQEIHASDFLGADLLFYIDLSRNEIRKLENQIFLNLKAIKEIDLSNNKIESIDEGAFDLIGGNLTRIDLSSNRIKNFKEDFILTMIINATRNWLPFDLNLKNNEIESIEPSNKNAILLPEVILQINGNKVKTLDLMKIEIYECILKNSTLESVNVNASFINFDNNRLKTYRIKGKTRSVSLQNNLISSLTYDDYLIVTRSMFLSRNNLSSDGLYDVLKKVSNLDTLDVSHNPLMSLKIDMFAENPLLQKLILSNTSLTKLSFGVFAYQEVLRILDISYNNFNEIDFHIFSSNVNLEILDLSGTNISEIKECYRIGEILPRLKLIGIEDNAWKCDALSSFKSCINSQLIKMMVPDNPTKNESNIMGIKCLYAANYTTKEASTTAPENPWNNTFFSSNFLTDFLKKINRLDEHFSQKNAYQNHITPLELTLSVFLAIVLTVMAAYGVKKAKNYWKINRFQMPRFSRRNSPDTIVTYDGSIGR